MDRDLHSLNRFTAEAVLSMDADERLNWDSLSEFERKGIAYSAWSFANAQRKIAEQELVWHIRVLA